MKKTIILAAIVCLTITNAFAQNCNYEKNEIDPVTKKQLKITKGEILTGKLVLNANMLAIKGIKNDQDILLLCGLTIQSKTEQTILVKKGYKVFLILEDGSNVEIESVADFKGTLFADKNFGNFQYGIDAQFEVTKDALAKIQNKKVKMVRMEVDMNGNKFNKDTEIKDKKQDEISNLLKCVN